MCIKGQSHRGQVREHAGAGSIFSERKNTCSSAGDKERAVKEIRSVEAAIV
jgi:hypothetical protein